MEALAGCEVVVAARLHGVLLGHVAGCPVIAVSHERKVRTLMEEMGHGRFCFEMDEFSGEAAWERLLEIRARRPELASDVRRRAGGYRHRVDAQYDQLFGSSP